MRELLEKISWQLEAFIEGNYWPNTHILLDEIKAELAKPDEPVAWMYDWSDGLSSQPVIDNLTSLRHKTSHICSFNVRPLYTHPPAQQKPLSDAAPDMYAALERLINSDKNISITPDDVFHEAVLDESLPDLTREQAASILEARAALAKARGG